MSVTQPESALPLVLIVDDDAAIRETMGDILEGAGFRVAFAANGQEALLYLANGPPPAMILCDLTMPVMDGREFCQRKHANARLAPIPLVVISGVARMQPDSQSLHALSLFEKPLAVSLLLELLQEIL